MKENDITNSKQDKAHDVSNPMEPNAILTSFIRWLSSPNREKAKWTDIVMVGLTIILAVIFYCQFYEIHRATTLDERAWMAVDGLGVQLEEGKPFLATIVIKNFGKTSAKNVTLQVSTQLVKKGDKADIRFADVRPQDPRGLIAPGKTITKADFPFAQTMQSIQKSDIEELENGEVSPHLYCKVTYDDIFSVTHWTTCCFYLAPDHQYKPCDHGNDTDSY